MTINEQLKKYDWLKAVSGGPSAVSGISASGVHCGLKPNGALDLALVVSDRPCATAAFFTQNKLLGAHIPVARKNLAKSGGMCSAVLVNSKNANCATGSAGEKDNMEVGTALATKLGVSSEQVAFASTGVIGVRLKKEKITDAMDLLIKGLSSKNAMNAAKAIMTTDTRPKMCAVEVNDGEKTYRIGGIAKGAGMICPNMATMFGFIFTDADLSVPMLEKLSAGCVKGTFNSISVDGDTSPNDTVLVLANGASGVKINQKNSEKFVTALYEVARYLSMEIVRDGEGATKLVHIEINGAASNSDAELIAKGIGNSLLVKTAIFGMDPNWGRIVSAAGVSGADFKPEKAELHIDGVCVYKKGTIPQLKKKIMRKKDVFIDLDCGLGRGTARFWTCDLSYDYVKINAEYTT